MSVLPKALQNLIDVLGKLPGVGPRTAERYAYFLYKNDPNFAKAISTSIENLSSDIKYCPKTFMLIDKSEEVSKLYTDSKRDKSIIAVVEDPFDVVALEKTASFSGTYHVLGGLISPIDGITPESLHISELMERVKADKVEELIIATNASVEGESTAYYLAKQFDGYKINISRLAQGLPIGLDIEYADQITLSRALEGRRSI